MSNVVLYEKRGNIGIFTLNRPEAMNAVSAELAARFGELLEAFEADDSAWIGVLRSSHAKVFCAGADLKSITKGGKLFTDKGGFAGFVNYPRTKPIIAAVDGLALAGGCELTLACDLIVASSKSQFGVPEVKRSLAAAAGGMYRLPAKLPQHIAMEMLLTGDPIPATRLHSFGFVNILTEPGQAFDEAIKLAERIQVNAPLAVRATRNAVLQSYDVTGDQAKAAISSKAMLDLAQTEDYFEGPRAFAEKRPPKWTGKKAKL